NPDGSLPLITRHWTNFPTDLILQVYAWNIIYEGAIPRLQECGPYTYVGHERKENLTWSSDGKEV
ncbi:hypothetical protein PMAYCL1PPCAC_10683, partial [Pristionchus mayeri]